MKKNKNVQCETVKPQRTKSEQRAKKNMTVQHFNGEDGSCRWHTVGRKGGIYMDMKRRDGKRGGRESDFLGIKEVACCITLGVAVLQSY